MAFIPSASSRLIPEGNTHIGRDGIRPVYEEVIGSLVTIESFQSFVNGNAGARIG